MAGTSLLGNITGWFKTPVQNYKVSTDLFGLLNQKTIAKELDLEKSGQENGSNELPTTNSQIPDDVESNI
tara:strand:+ start:460 stop:669 length:210 start_codon:yes stop_codon:yes gene_type:complete